MNKIKSVCCKAQFKWVNKEKRLHSNLPFLVCSKCNKGGGETFWAIEDKELKELDIKL